MFLGGMPDPHHRSPSPRRKHKANSFSSRCTFKRRQNPRDLTYSTRVRAPQLSTSDFWASDVPIHDFHRAHDPTNNLSVDTYLRITNGDYANITAVRAPILDLPNRYQRKMVHTVSIRTASEACPGLSNRAP